MKKKSCAISDLPIYLEQVTVSRDEHNLLRNVDLSLKEGDMVYLIGPVGAGKSSLLEVLYGELPISSGTGNVLGNDLRHLNISKRQAMRRRMGIVFQSSGQLLYDRTVEANLDFVLRATTSLSKSERKERIRKGLTDVGMEGKGYKYPHELSGGEAARICIARALIIRPELILMDEPTAGLDNETALSICLLMRTIAQSGVAVLMSTHNKYVIKHCPAKTYAVDPINQSLVLLNSIDELSTL